MSDPRIGGPSQSQIPDSAAAATPPKTAESGGRSFSVRSGYTTFSKKIAEFTSSDKVGNFLAAINPKNVSAKTANVIAKNIFGFERTGKMDFSKLDSITKPADKRKEQADENFKVAKAAVDALEEPQVQLMNEIDDLEAKISNLQKQVLVKQASTTGLQVAQKIVGDSLRESTSRSGNISLEKQADLKELQAQLKDKKTELKQLQSGSSSDLAHARAELEIATAQKDLANAEANKALSDKAVKMQEEFLKTGEPHEMPRLLYDMIDLKKSQAKHAKRVVEAETKLKEAVHKMDKLDESGGTKRLHKVSSARAMSGKKTEQSSESDAIWNPRHAPDRMNSQRTRSRS